MPPYASIPIGSGNAEQREQSDGQSYFLPKGEPLVSASEFLARASRPPGRYKSPLGVVDRLVLEYQKHLSEFGTASAKPSYVFGNMSYPVPPQWQAIFEYLYAGGYITSRYASFEKFFNDEPKIFSLRLFATFDQTLTDGRGTAYPGYSRGVSYDFEEALSKVIGEFLERYPLLTYRRKDFLRASMAQLSHSGKNFFDINELAGFTDWQKEIYPHRRFNESSNFFWAEGRELLSGKKVLIPAQLVFWNYDTLQEPMEPYLRQPITNGAAGHFTSAEAILAGIYENIQRDAFLVYWLNNVPPPRIDVSTIRHPDLQRSLQRFSRYGMEIVFLDTTLDLQVPSCVCVLMDTTGRGPKLSVGGGCGPDLEEAMMRGVTEATGVYHWMRTEWTEPYSLPDDYVPFRDPFIGQDARLSLWGRATMFERLQPFLGGKMQSVRKNSYPHSFASPEEELKHILDILREKGKGYEVYVYEAKHHILDDLGYASVRTIIPALVPLYLQESSAPLGAERLRSAITTVGGTPSTEFNPWPHPFP